MFKLRGCPECHGDLYTGEDVYGAYLACVQCGRYYTVAESNDRARRREPAVPAVGPPELAELDLAA